MRASVLAMMTLLGSAGCGQATGSQGADAGPEDVGSECRSSDPCITKSMNGDTCHTQAAPDGTPCSQGACIAGVCTPSNAADAGVGHDAASPDAAAGADASAGLDASQRPDAGTVPGPDAGSQLPGVLAAFPGCEGSGCHTRGGFDTSVGTPAIYRVTTLERGTGPGTLGACIAASGPRVCVFAVAGELVGGGYTITNPYITIRGDTAPGMGVSLTNNGVAGTSTITTKASHVVIRGLRFRDGNVNSATDDGTIASLHWPSGTGTAMDHVVLDHLSVSWGNDETLAIYSGSQNATPPRYVTVSNSMVYEGLLDTGTFARGMLAAAGDPAHSDQMVDIDIHHNYLANNYERNPNLRVRRGRLVNNIIYNHACTGGAHIEGGIYADVINNLGRYGPNWNPTCTGIPEPVQNNPQLFIVGYRASQAAVAASPLGLPGDQSIYLEGNKMYGGAVAGWDSALVIDLTSAGYVTPERRSAPLAASPTGPAITIDAADELPAKLIAPGGVGHSRRLDCGGSWATNGVRDAADQRVIDSFWTPPASYAFPRTPADVGGFPVVTAIASSEVCAAGSRDNGSCVCADGDEDGLPDYWESAFCGSSTGCAALEATVAPPWTNLEAFMSGSVAAP